LIPESEKKATHLKIGQLLLNNTNVEERKENIFALVNQLNFGTDLLNEESEKRELAELNLMAGKKAKAATAYDAAVNYLNVGLELLVNDSWQKYYELTVEIYVEAVEAEYLNTNFERSQRLADLVLQQAKNLIDRVKVYELKIQSYRAENQMLKAVETGFNVLKMLDVDWEKGASNFVIDLPDFSDLAEIPEMTDVYHLAAMRILMAVSGPVYVTQPELWSSIVLTQVKLCAKHGYSEIAASAYAQYGVILCAILEIDAGYNAGKLALKLLDKFNAKSFKCQAKQLYYSHIKPWKKPFKDTLSPLQSALQDGLEVGDFEWSGYALTIYCSNIFFTGESVELVAEEQAKYLGLAQKIKQEYVINYIKIWQQLSLNLLGKSTEKYLLIGEVFNELEALPAFLEKNNRTLLFLTYLGKTILLYLLRETGSALNSASLAAEHLESVMGMIVASVHNFYYSLSLLAEYPQGTKQEQEKYLHQVELNQEKMQFWASYAPGNFQHKYDLVEAEKARFLGQKEKAIDLYEQAITEARLLGYIQEEALANELAGEFHLAEKRENLGRFYITEAYYGYIRWGAIAKVNQMVEKYPEFLAKVTSEKPLSWEVKQVTTSTSQSTSSLLDLSTIMKASFAISGEIVLSNLLERIMEIAIENAGAEKGFLLLKEAGKWVIYTSDSEAVNDVNIMLSSEDEISQPVPMGIINYVERTEKSLVLNDASNEGIFINDPYILRNKPQSVLCKPIINQRKLIGLVYLENNLTTGAFTSERLEILKLIFGQAAISLENARLYAKLEAANQKLEDYSRNLEIKVAERTEELKEKNQSLKQTLKQLQQTQTQLIQTEKMSSLGQLVAGIAHEINNPINFIHGNLTHTHKYAHDLLALIALYQQTYPKITAEISEKIEEIDIVFLAEDLPKILNSMKVGADRIRQIVLSLQNFSRLNESNLKSVDIHQGLDSTLLILQHRLPKATAARETNNYSLADSHSKEIEVIKEYGKIPKVECYAGQLNQVFMNIINNAMDALEENQHKTTSSPTIRIQTQLVADNKLAITIADNGPGMTEKVKKHIFDPFFSTKPVGSGTGLGLSISYQIVVERHGGQLKCNSAPGQGSEFIIEIPLQAQQKIREAFPQQNLQI